MDVSVYTNTMSFFKFAKVGKTATGFSDSRLAGFGRGALYVVLLCFTSISLADSIDPLPSWRDGQVKSRIIEFVAQVTDPNSGDYVSAPKRIATFDNDGTLWSEQPFYFQLFYTFDTVNKLASQHPEWKKEEPFASVLKGDYKNVMASGEEGLLKLLAATHTGMTTEAFSEQVSAWLSTAKHPKTQQRFNDMVFQPMLELLNYLRVNDFKTFIVSGGGIDLIRVFSEDTYGIPPEQVVGSSVKAKYQVVDGKPEIIKLAEIDFVDDKEGKPVGIHQNIGRRPIFAAGNSDGDYQMLEWTTSSDMPSLGIIIHHTDAEREWAYDRDSHIGGLDKGLDDAGKKGWLLVDMKQDWEVIYPYELQSISKK